MSEFLEEIWDEISDFFEDFWEHLSRQKAQESPRIKTAVVGGIQITVRPAFLFAERVDNLLKIIFGLSIAISAFTATFLGFSSLSDLLDVLITSIWGRTIMFIIGISYLITSIWKLFHLDKSKP